MLSALQDRPVSEGGRNDWLTAVSGHFAKMHRDKKDLFESQVRMANQTLPSPLGDREVAKIMKSIWESERANNADRDQIEKLSADNGHLIAHGDRDTGHRVGELGGNTAHLGAFNGAGGGDAVV